MQIIPARSGVAVPVGAGSHIRIINTHGSQVVDTWAFCRHDTSEFMSMEHTRASCRSLRPIVGESLITNQRRPILTLAQDSTDGTHDTLIAACDEHRYRLLGHQGFHENCNANLHTALHALGASASTTPCPLNLFMNVSFDARGLLTWKPPTSQPGDYVEFRAELDCIVVLSACPMDLLPINGAARTPTEAHFLITPHASGASTA